MKEELFDERGINKIPENKKGEVKEKECLTLEEIEKLLTLNKQNNNEKWESPSF